MNIVNDRFKIVRAEHEGRLVFYLQGDIDEDSVFNQIGQEAGELIINWKGVTSINSCGVRNWVNFIKTMSDRTTYYIECPPLVVKQMNMIPSFLGNATVYSVYVPYVCDNCDTEKLVLVTAEKFSAVDETIQCENCQSPEMELDGHPKHYFTFGKAK